MNAQVQPSAARDMAVSQEFEILKPELAKVLPAHVTADKFLRVVMTAVAQSQDLRSAAAQPSGRKSLLSSCVKCATDGLVPDGREAALVTFKTKNGPMVQYMPMVRGILKLVRNSGELKSLAVQVVYEKDEFNYWIDDVGEHITHKPNILVPDRGKLLAVYAIAETKDGGRYVEVMSRGQIEQVRNVSRAKDNGPWVAWYDEMAKKSVIRRLSKKLPMSTDLEQVVQRDDALYDLNQGKLEARSGRDATKALLGLPVLPDADDVAAAGSSEETVDTDTGEVIEGETTQTTDEAPPAKPQPQPLDPADADAARVAQEIETLKAAAGDGRKALVSAWNKIKAAYKADKVAPPLDVETYYTDLLGEAKD